MKKNTRPTQSKLVDYAENGNKVHQTASFAKALKALTDSHLGTASARTVIDVITKLFKADEDLNQPHTLLVHQRSKLLFELLGAYATEMETDHCWTTVKKMAVLKPYAQEIPALIETVAKSTQKQVRTKLVLLISCLPRLSIAKATRARLQQILGADFRILIVIGQRETPMHPALLSEDFLVVDANDNYESLPDKIAKTLEFIYTKFEKGTRCFKVDEDLSISDGIQLEKLMSSLSNSNLDYAGFAGNNRDNFERTWHYGKCEDITLSRRPYGKRYPGAFAYGPFYYLSEKSIQAFVSENIRFPDEIIGHLYEDKFIGDTLREAGITISALSPEEWVPAVGQHWWTINRFWSGQENKLLPIN